jgi:hypothetical protein
MFLCRHRVDLPVTSRNVAETQDADVCIMVYPKFWADYYVLICIHHFELMKSVGSHGLVTAIHDEGDSLKLCE